MFSLSDTRVGPGAFLYAYNVVSGGGIVYLVVRFAYHPTAPTLINGASQAMYPMLVIVLVNVNQSQLDVWQVGRTRSGTLRFAGDGHGDRHSTAASATITHHGVAGEGTSWCSMTPL